MQTFMSLDRNFKDLMSDRAELLDADRYSVVVEDVADALSRSLRGGGTIYWCGNGGSAAQAQHLSAEFSGRFLRERRGLASEALSVNTSTLTAIGNDFGYEFVFSRQVEAFVKPGDAVIALTTSGKSLNLIKALEQAQAMGALTVAFTGNGGGPITAAADYSIVAPNGYSAIVQELHLILGHILCDLVEQRVMAAESVPTSV